MSTGETIVRAAILGVVGSLIGYFYGSLFGYVVDRVFADEPYGVNFHFVTSVFAGMGWAAGLIIGWLTGLALWKKGD